MSLRLRLIVAFLLLSVVPLGAVTIYSYVSSYKALQTAATREADQLAAELSQRMQLVTTQLSERVEHLMDVSSSQPVVRTAQVRTPPPAKVAKAKENEKVQTAEPEPETDVEPAVTVAAQAADALGEAAMLLNSLELRGPRGGGGGGGRFGVPSPGGARGTFRGRGNNPVLPGTAPFPLAPTPAPSLMPPFPAGQPGESTEPPRQAGDRRQQGRFGPPPPPDNAFVGPRRPEDDDSRIRVDVGPIARDIIRQMGVPEGTNLNQLTGAQQRQIAAEINQRMVGITEGLKIAAAKLEQKAEEARRKAAEDAKAMAATPPSAPAAPVAPAPPAMKRRTALSGNRLEVALEQNGKVVRTANAEINLPNVLMTVFSSMPRGQGEVPFAVGRDGQIYTPTSADRASLEHLTPAKLPDGASMFREWIIVMTKDPTGSGLRLGIARPVGDSLAELRRIAGRNAGLGLLSIGLAIALIIPLSGRLTRNLTLLTDAVKRIAHGEYATRVRVKSKDEIGELGAAFNQMAAEVEAHQRTAVEQERIKRELELGRQIQHDMQPQAPLVLGLTEIQGVSVPAREVGGDFFNYFLLPAGEIALVVGDVSGKGVGAALLMANIQASLRTRFALGQNLSAIADAIDRDIESNSPGQMYATLFIGILDAKQRALRYVNAGHHPQYVLGTRAGGRGIHKMGATGLPAGLLAGRGYSELTVELDRGDLIFFYTDGLPETENDREEMFGAEAIEELVRTSGPGGPDDVLHRVEAALKQFRGSREPYDDATMMAVRVG
jgi:serine phosphatase RsbU (regulator of sigma subunit)